MLNAIPVTAYKSITPEFSFSEELPYLSYLNNIYTLTNNRKGFVFEITPLAMADEGVAHDIESIMTGILPDGATMQFHVYSCPNMGFIFDIANKIIRPYSDSIVNPDLYANILKFQEEKLKSEGVRRWKYYVSITVPNKDKADEICGSIKEILTGIGLRPIIVYPQRLINVLSEILNQSDGNKRLHYDPEVHIRDQIMHSNTIIKYKMGRKSNIQINDTYLVGLKVSQYPEDVYLPLMNNILGDQLDNGKQINYPFLITFNYIQPHGQETTAAKISGKAVTTRSNAIGSSFSSRLSNRIKSLGYMQYALSDRHYAVRCYMHFTLFSLSKEDIPKVRENMKTVARNIGISLVDDGMASMPAFLSDLPMNLQENMHGIGYAETIHSQVASNMVLVQGDYHGEKNPAVILVTPRKDIAPISLFLEGGNSNITVSGGSGSGKSVTLNAILMYYAALASQMFVFDKGFSMGPITQLHGGDILRFDNKQRISINPFSNISNIDLDVDFIWPIFSNMINPGGTLSQAFIELLKEKIREEYFDKGQDGGVQGVYERLDKTELGRQLTICMKSWAKGGNYHRFVEGESSISFKKQFSLLEMSEINNIPALKAVIVPLYLYQVYQHCFSGDKSIKKIVTMDEAHSYFHGGSIIEFMSTFGREIRKYNGMLLTATQLQSDYFSHPAIVSVYKNCDTHIFLRQNASRSIEYEGLDEYDFKMINSMRPPTRYAELYIKSEFYRGKFKVYNSDYMNWLFTTTPDKKVIRDKYFEESKDIHKAIVKCMDMGHSPLGSSNVSDDFY